MTMIPHDAHLQIGSLLFEGIDQIDMTGPFEVLSRLRIRPIASRSERTYRCRRTRRFGVMCAEQGACVRRRSCAGYTINMFEFEFPTGTACGRTTDGGFSDIGPDPQVL
jgi:hypothetical protein